MEVFTVPAHARSHTRQQPRLSSTSAHLRSMLPRTQGTQHKGAQSAHQAGKLRQAGACTTRHTSAQFDYKAMSPSITCSVVVVHLDTVLLVEGNPALLIGALIGPAQLLRVGCML